MHKQNPHAANVSATGVRAEASPSTEWTVPVEMVVGSVVAMMHSDTLWLVTVGASILITFCRSPSCRKPGAGECDRGGWTGMGICGEISGALWACLL